MFYEKEKINTLLEGILGTPKNEGYSNGWTSYNCPYCSINNGGAPDNKYNLEINVTHGSFFHCWKCERHGKISKLIKDFGLLSDLSEYRFLISELKNSALYNSFNNANQNKTEIETENIIELPNGFKKIDINDANCCEALQYLSGRNIDSSIIGIFNIGYIDNSNNDFSLRNRIIIPSYGTDDCLNYWVGRDFTGKNKIKYKNPQVPKTSIIFNEKLINWYADITLVEGPFDHIVVPNSIPLLGKTLSSDSVLYKTLTQKAQANINILLDADAYDNAIKLYKTLNHGVLKDKIYAIPIKNNYDASLVYQKFGKKGIIELLKRATHIDEYDLQSFS